MNRERDLAIERLRMSVKMTHALEGCAKAEDLIWLDIVDDEDRYIGAFIGAGFDELRQVLIAAEVLDVFPSTSFHVFVYKVPHNAQIPYRLIMRKLERTEALALRQFIYQGDTGCPPSATIH